MDVKLSIREEDAGMSNTIKEKVKKDDMDLSKEEEIWRSRGERIKNALAASRAAARQEPADLYAAASEVGDVIKRADVEEFISEIERLADQTDLSATFNFQGLPRGSILHIAVLAGKGDILRLLLDNVHDHIVATKDEWGDTPLHIATKTKAIGFIDMLIGRVKDLPNGEDKLLLRMKNNHGNTALHEAVLKGDVGLVSHLLGKDLEPVYLKNVDEKSPLYLALDTGNSKILEVLFTKSLKPWKIEGMPPVHGAIMRRNYDLIDKILKLNMKLFAMTDSSGGNVFHLEAFLNKPQALEFLRPETKYLARERDMNGDLPIHIASKMGHVALIKKLHPVSQSVNGQGQTVLHVATKYGRASTVKDILKHLDLGKLINQRDCDGNTPLHLAAIHSQPATLIHLLLDKRIKPCLLNHERLTAFDIALRQVRSDHTFRKVMAASALGCASDESRDLLVQRPEARDETRSLFDVLNGLPHPKLYKDAINTRLVVAALVTTVTFTAGFTVPGGFNGWDTASKEDRGEATMLDKRMFQSFAICNTMAMFCSMIAVIHLRMAQQSDFHKAIAALLHSLAPLTIALLAMSAAFLSGVTLTIGKLPWLANTIFYLGLFFFLLISCSIVSEYTPFFRIRHRLIRSLMLRFGLAYINWWLVDTSLLDESKEP